MRGCSTSSPFARWVEKRHENSADCPRRFHFRGTRSGPAYRPSNTFAPGAKRKHGPRSFLTRSEAHTSELQSLMRISYAVFCLKQKNKQHERIFEREDNR